MKKPYALLAALIVASCGAFAQAYPSRPIRFVVGFPAGSSIDIVSRIVLDDIRERTGAAILVDNKAGALGSLGLAEVVAAAPDGYTLMPSSSATHSSGPYLSRALEKLQPQVATTHIARLVQFNIAVVTNASGPYKNAEALFNAGRKRPDSLTYGFGSGTGQVAGTAFSKAGGLSARPIPYKGQPPAITDLLGSQIDFVAADLGVFLPFLRQGSLTAVAVLSDKRSSILPNVPTMAELGYAGLVLNGWIGVDGPARLPADVSTWWTHQIRLALATARVQDKLKSVGIEPAPMFGNEFSKFVADQYGVWGRYVHDAGITVE